MDLETLKKMYPTHKLVTGEQYAQESITALKVRTILMWSDTIFVDCDFSEAHLHLLVLRNVIFLDCDFAGANFVACDIDYSEFINCNITCADFHASSVEDTSFTDCLIGGMKGPLDFSSCTFTHPRYSRRIPIVSQVPYFVCVTQDAPLYIFRTPDDWRIHYGGNRYLVSEDEVERIEEPYKTIIRSLQVTQNGFVMADA